MCLSIVQRRRKLLCLLLGVWMTVNASVMFYSVVVVDVTERYHQYLLRAEAAAIRAAIDAMDTYLDQTGVCDKLSRDLLSPEGLNATAIESCRRWLNAQRDYFRLKETRVNYFDAGRLTMKGENICTNDTQMIILVHSLHKYTDRRNAIRKTWGGASVDRHWPPIYSLVRTGNTTVVNSTSAKGAATTMNGTKVRLAFIFGQLFDEADSERLLRQESYLHGDIIQGEFGESYRNMTLKSLTGLHWVSTYCPSARFLLKCDDDMFVNVPAVLEIIRTENMTRAILGPYNTGSRVYRKGKWAISKAEYPFYYYPPYESGSGYVISADLWSALLNASDYVPYIFIDDVYITGILGRIVGVRHIVRTGFAYWTNKAPHPCAIVNGTVVTGTRVDPARQFSIWANLTKGNLDC